MGGPPPFAVGGETGQRIIDVEIIGCDQSGKCTTILTSIDTSMMEIPVVTDPSQVVLPKPVFQPQASPH